MWHSYRLWGQSSEHDRKIPPLLEFSLKVETDDTQVNIRLYLLRAMQGILGKLTEGLADYFIWIGLEKPDLRTYLSKYLHTREKPACEDQREEHSKQREQAGAKALRWDWKGQCARP